MSYGKYVPNCRRVALEKNDINSKVYFRRLSRGNRKHSGSECVEFNAPPDTIQVIPEAEHSGKGKECLPLS